MVHLLERVKRFGAIRHDDEGRIRLWGITGILLPNFSRVISQEHLRRSVGDKESQKILYTQGKLQSYFTFRMISEKYGYKKKLADRIRLLRFNLGQGEMVGYGSYKLRRYDIKTKIFVITGNSTLAEEYRKLMGIRHGPVDHFARGCFSAYVEAVTDEEMFCVETRCISKGDKSCEFVIKPLSDWRKDDMNFKEQSIEMPDCRTILSDLGIKLYRKNK